MTDNSSSRPVVIWLWILVLMVVATVWVGGMTRLTESGLSMVDWKPFMGALPPLSEVDWEQRFADYQQYPEYVKLRPDMELAEFKSIFRWEYAHRMVGRSIGIVFLFPYLFFLIRRKIPQGYQRRILIAFLLGGAQGLLGWYMVKSGLVDNPHVSHYRLAAHFSLALFVLGYLVWVICSLSPKKVSLEANSSLRGIRAGVYAWSGLLACQIVYGAFVAGLNAGYSYNTFPKMLGYWIPPGLMALESVCRNLFSNPLTVQFIHRSLAWCLLGGIIVLVIGAKRMDVERPVRVKLTGLMHLIIIQFLLGVATLVMNMPVHIAAAHQINICLIILVLVRLLHMLGDAKATT